MGRNDVQEYTVAVRREDEAHSWAMTGEHRLLLGTRRGDQTAGFNAAQTLLAALGACLISNISYFAELLRLEVEEVQIDLRGLRADKPPGLFQIDYIVNLVSREPEDKLQKLCDLAAKWGTVTNTLVEGVEPKGTIRISRSPE